MQIKLLHSCVIMPTKATPYAGAYDVYMPEAGTVSNSPKFFGLGFAAAVPQGYVALLLPRSSTGTKYGLELNNTCGVIDSDYRGEWKASLRTKNNGPFSWEAGDRILQFLVIPICLLELEPVDDLPESERGTGGFGSTGK